jgi:hypothetical protein
MTSKSVAAADVQANCRELLRIVKNRPPCILTELETNRLITYLEACIAEIETGISAGLEGKKSTG